MAPTTTPGVNPAPLYKEKTNAIAALMARHTSSPSLSFLSSLPSRKPGSAGAAPPPKTAAQLAAQAEDYELDRMAQYDDNMGVGMFAPENRKEKEETRRKELEDRRLKARLGIGAKRKGSEWEGVSGVARARAQDSDDEEEMGRSGVGRAKKRQRVVAREERPAQKPESKDPEDAEMAQAAAQEQLDATPNDKGEGDDETAQAQHDGDQEPKSPQAVALSGNQPNPEAEAKKKRKKKKKNKSKSQTLDAASS